jgi:hypothetical protein
VTTPRWKFIEEWAPRFPLRTFSVSSYRSYKKCPEKWRRVYIDGEYEQRSGAMLAGSATWAAESRSLLAQIETRRPLPAEQVLDLFSDEWNELAEREPPLWGKDDKPGVVKDRAGAALARYHRLVAPNVRPLAVERQFRLVIEDLPWTLKGYIDYERLTYRRRSRASIPVDVKMSASRMNQADADSDIQVGLYLASRRAQRDPAPGFELHQLLRQVNPDIELVPTQRTDAQLDQVLEQLLYTAAEIGWRTELGIWDGAAPGAWWCGTKSCGFFASCPYGGLHARPVDSPQEVLT